MNSYCEATNLPNIESYNIRCAPIHLNEITSSEFLIKFVNDDFCLINKPPDIRLNGDHDITIEKILLNWSFDLSVENLKWIHRLDFSTSGVLCIGLNKKSGCIASSAFECRKVAKEYLAVVDGIIDLSKWELKSSYIKTKELSHGNVASNILNKKILECSIQKSWQQDALESSLDLTLKALRKLSLTNTESDDSELNSILSLDENFLRKNSKARKKVRKFLKSRGIIIDFPKSEMINFSETAKIENIERDNLKLKLKSTLVINNPEINGN